MHQSARSGVSLALIPEESDNPQGSQVPANSTENSSLAQDVCTGVCGFCRPVSVLMKTPLRAILLLTPQHLGCSWCCHGSSPLQGLRKIMFLGELQWATTVSELNGICPFLSFLILDYYCYLLSLKSPYNNNNLGNRLLPSENWLARIFEVTIFWMLFSFDSLSLQPSLPYQPALIIIPTSLLI